MRQIVVHRNLSRREVEGDALDHGRDGGLGHRADAASPGARPDRRVAADRDDATAVVHPDDRRLDGEEDAAHVQPGPTETDMTAAMVARLREVIPVGRMGQPDEIAALVSYLAGPEAGYMTGSSLTIDGGYVL
jgi:Enoyl-(Acyl carrier protein) reductase